MKTLLKKIPLMGPAAQRVYRTYFPKRGFSGSEAYWDQRYVDGGTSGDGSYRRLAEFKAEFLNSFVVRHSIDSIIEFGCGDGNQLRLAEYPDYVGYDVSQKAIEICNGMYKHDSTKRFSLLRDYAGQKASLVISLDVIYHLVEDSVFETYMQSVFGAAKKYVIIYSSNVDAIEPGALHVRHRNFTRWVDRNCASWRLIDQVRNAYPFSGDTRAGSFADFFCFARDENR